jgi:hypothetical protein
LEQLPVSPLCFIGSTQPEKAIPLLFSLPHSFRGRQKKSDFYSARLSRLSRLSRVLGGAYWAGSHVPDAPVGDVEAKDGGGGCIMMKNIILGMETDDVISKWLFEVFSNAGSDAGTARNGCEVLGKITADQIAGRFPQVRAIMILIDIDGL